MINSNIKLSWNFIFLLSFENKILTNPKEDRNQCFRAVVKTHVSTRSNCEIPSKKWQPTKQKCSHHNTERNKGFVFLSPGCMDPVPLS